MPDARRKIAAGNLVVGEASETKLPTVLGVVAGASWRYLAIALQFLVVVLVTNRLDTSGAATYFALFGVAQFVYVFAGLGLPDGVIRHAPALAVREGTTAHQQFLSATYWLSLRISAAMGVLAVALGISLGPLAAWCALWGVGYGLIFVSSQFLVASRRTMAATFIFYSLVPLATAAATLAILVSGADSASAFVLTSALAAFACAVAATFFTWFTEVRTAPWRLRYRFSGDLRSTLATGAYVLAGRVVMVGIIWAPVWIATIVLSGGFAATVAVAARLASAAAALIAAVRFSVRPVLAEQAAHHDWQAMASTVAGLARVTTAVALVALAAVSVGGDAVIPRIFGPEYVGVTLVTGIFLIGVLAESLAGPVDEALKMSGHARSVLLVQVAALTTALLLEVFLASIVGSAASVAAGHALAISLMYAALTLRFHGATGEWSYPWRSAGRDA